MDNGTLITIIISVSALFVAILTLIVTIATLRFKYGLNGRFPRVITPADEKKERLQNEISELERKL